MNRKWKTTVEKEQIEGLGEVTFRFSDPVPNDAAAQPPDSIWLQPDHEHVWTWCSEQINDDDPEYVRVRPIEQATTLETVEAIGRMIYSESAEDLSLADGEVIAATIVAEYIAPLLATLGATREQRDAYGDRVQELERVIEYGEDQLAESTRRIAELEARPYSETWPQSASDHVQVLDKRIAELERQVAALRDVIVCEEENHAAYSRDRKQRRACGCKWCDDARNALAALEPSTAQEGT